jgi:pyrroloquinoline quinone biosynthesis protein D
MIGEMRVRLDDRFEIHPHFLFRWEASQEAHVLLYPEGVVKLNETAGEILKRCTGTVSVGELIADLARLFPDSDADIATSVTGFLETAHAKGWIRSRPA